MGFIGQKLSKIEENSIWVTIDSLCVSQKLRKIKENYFNIHLILDDF